MAATNGHTMDSVEARRPRWARDTAPEDFESRERDLELIRRSMRIGDVPPARRKGGRMRRRVRIEAELWMLMGVVLLLIVLMFLQAFWMWAPT